MNKLISMLILVGIILVPAWSFEAQAKQNTVKTYSNININEDRLVLINKPIRMDMAKTIVNDIYNLTQENSKDPIFYVINTNGGSLTAGNKIIQAMESSSTKSICVVDRAAYSMGALILSHCNVAYIHKSATVMFHEGYMYFEGKVSEVISYIDFEKKEFDKLNRETAKLLKMPLGKYVTKQKNDWWLTAEDTVRSGLAKGVLLKLAYPIPEEPDQRSFFTFGWSREDGIFDLSWYSVRPSY